MPLKLTVILITFIFSSIGFAKQSTPEIIIERVHHNIYLHKSYQHVDGYGLVSANGLVVIEENKAFIVDTPWTASDTEKLVNWIKVNKFIPAGSVSTHSHEDRTGGINWLNDNDIPTYATEQTNKLLKQEGKAQAENEFSETTYVIPGTSIEVFYPGEGHAPDNVVVWLPKQKLLFGGCFIKSRASKSLGYTGNANIQQWPISIDKVAKKYSDALIVVPGHGRVDDIFLLEKTRNLATDALKK